MTTDSKPIGYPDPRCGYAAGRPGHVCKDSHHRPLGKPGLDGVCDIWARHEAYLGRELMERLDADSDLIFARLAELFADDRLERRRAADASNTRLRAVVAGILSRLQPASVVDALRQALDEAEQASRAAEWAPEVAS